MNNLQTKQCKSHAGRHFTVRLTLTFFFMTVFCHGMVALPLPDSLLTRDAAYRYMFVDR